MGSAGNSLPASDREQVIALADHLGAAIAEANCVLVTGETSGVPGRVAAAAHANGGLTVRISPAHSEQEHLERYQNPDIRSDVVIYTGFGLKGRNVVNVELKPLRGDADKYPSKADIA